MTTWGFIGSGNIGGTVARLAVTAGHDVVLSDSRGPQTLADLVSQLGPHARAATTREAGDDEAAKSTVRALLDEIGYGTLDLGPLSEGWRTQRDTAAYGTPYATEPADWGAGLGPAGVEKLASLAAQARRYRDM